jgi:hypothetical protein
MRDHMHRPIAKLLIALMLHIEHASGKILSIRRLHSAPVLILVYPKLIFGVVKWRFVSDPNVAAPKITPINLRHSWKRDNQMHVVLPGNGWFDRVRGGDVPPG